MNPIPSAPWNDIYLAANYLERLTGVPTKDILGPGVRTTTVVVSPGHELKFYSLEDVARLHPMGFNPSMKTRMEIGRAVETARRAFATLGAEKRGERPAEAEKMEESAAPAAPGDGAGADLWVGPQGFLRVLHISQNRFRAYYGEAETPVRTRIEGGETLYSERDLQGLRAKFRAELSPANPADWVGVWVPVQEFAFLTQRRESGVYKNLKKKKGYDFKRPFPGPYLVNMEEAAAQGVDVIRSAVPRLSRVWGSRPGGQNQVEPEGPAPGEADLAGACVLAAELNRLVTGGRFVFLRDDQLRVLTDILGAARAPGLTP